MEIINRKAKFNYEIIDEIEVGIELKGTEIKSIRKGSADLSDAYARIKKGEVFDLTNVRSIRPSTGLKPKYMASILGKHAAIDIPFGTPLSEDMIK